MSRPCCCCVEVLPAEGDDVLMRTMSRHWSDFAHDGRVDGWTAYSAGPEGRMMTYMNGGGAEMVRDEQMMARFALLQEADLVGSTVECDRTAKKLQAKL